MNQSFNIAGLPGQAPGNGVTAGFGTTQPGNGAQAPKGLFSSLVSLMSGNQGGTKISDLVKVGSPEQTGQAWLNLQVGDASLSLSAQALTNAITPRDGLEMAAEIADELNLDELVLSGLNTLGQSLNGLQNPAQNLSAPIPAQRIGSDAAAAQAGQLTGIQLASMQGAQALNTAAQAQAQATGPNTTPDAPAATPGTSAQTPDQALQAIARSLTGAQPSDILELLALQGQNPASKATTGGDPLSVASNLNANAIKQAAQGTLQPTGLTGLAAEQVRAGDQAANRDSLAAQLQQQLSGNGEKTANQPPQNSTANNAANPTATPQGQNGLNVALSALPFVQTRQVVTSDDPLALTQGVAQNAAGRAEQAAMFRPVQAAYQAPQINYPGMAVEIARNFNAGINQFKIRLDPPELGRIDVRMQVDDKGVVNARLSVERAETLDLLLRDARALERALTQAGLDGARTNLEFSLKQNPSGGDGFDRHHPDSRPGENDASGSGENNAATEPAIAAYQGTVRPGGLSLWA